MRKFLFLCIFFLVGLIGRSQKVYFIYLESENATPFYLKMGNRIHSSSPAGYLILSNLVDSIYSFSIGLAGKREVEPKFQVAVSGGDLGFLIKEQDQKFLLVDLQSNEVIAPLATSGISIDTYIMRDDIFTRTLSLAVNDPSLMLEVVRNEPAKGKASKEKDVAVDMAIVKAPDLSNLSVPDSLIQSSVDSASLVSAQLDANKADTITNIVGASTDTASVAQIDTGIKTIDTAVIKKTVAVVDTIVNKDTVAAGMAAQAVLGRDTLQKEVIKTTEEAVATNFDSTNTLTGVVTKAAENEVEFKRSTVVRYSESSTTTGFGLTFIDFIGSNIDTIRLLIPNPKPVFKTATEVISRDEIPATIAGIEVTAQVDTIVNTIQQADPIEVDSAAAVADKLKGNCLVKATDQDVVALQSDMRALDTDVGMINTATLVFKEKCFTTEQIRSLSALFTKEQWKFLFFEAAYKYIADVENFPLLESEIKDDYYIYRFKALIAK